MSLHESITGARPVVTVPHPPGTFGFVIFRQSADEIKEAVGTCWRFLAEGIWNFCITEEIH